MTTRQHIYDEYHSVDDHLLHQISKYVRFEELRALSREIGITETERQKEMAKESPHDQIFQVCNSLCTQRLSLPDARYLNMTTFFGKRSHIYAYIRI